MEMTSTTTVITLFIFISKFINSLAQSYYTAKKAYTRLSAGLLGLFVWASFLLAGHHCLIDCILFATAGCVAGGWRWVATSLFHCVRGHLFGWVLMVWLSPRAPKAPGVGAIALLLIGITGISS